MWTEKKLCASCTFTSYNPRAPVRAPPRKCGPPRSSVEPVVKMRTSTELRAFALVCAKLLALIKCVHWIGWLGCRLWMTTNSSKRRRPFSRSFTRKASRLQTRSKRLFLSSFRYIHFFQCHGIDPQCLRDRPVDRDRRIGHPCHRVLNLVNWLLVF